MTGAHTFTFHLGGRRHGHNSTTPWPVGQPEARPNQRALHVEYWVGCVTLFCDGAGCAVPDIVHALLLSRILKEGREFGYYDHGTDPQEPMDRWEERDRRHRRARKLWEGSALIQETPAEMHPRKMGITCELPDTLRAHQSHAAASLLSSVAGRDA